MYRVLLYLTDGQFLCMLARRIAFHIEMDDGKCAHGFVIEVFADNNTIYTALIEDMTWYDKIQARAVAAIEKGFFDLSDVGCFSK